MSRKSCMLIQWEKVTVDDKQQPICPECGEPAHLVIGLIGPCYAHAPQSTVEKGGET